MSPRTARSTWSRTDMDCHAWRNTIGPSHSLGPTSPGDSATLPLPQRPGGRLQRHVRAAIPTTLLTSTKPRSCIDTPRQRRDHDPIATVRPHVMEGESVEPASGLSQPRRALLERWRAGRLDMPADEIVARAPHAAVPLSGAQRRLWFLEQLSPGTSAYALFFAAWVRGALDEPALTRSAGELVRRHETLRTRIDTAGAHQEVLPASAAGLHLETASCAGDGDAVRLAHELLRRPFDLDRAPLVRLGLFRLAADRHLLALVVHHIVSDGWSLGVALRELAALYESVAAGRPSPLATPRLHYGDYVLWQRSRLERGAWRDQLPYWRERLAGVPVLELPVDRARPAVQSLRGGSVEVRLRAPLTARLRDLSRAENATPFMTLLAGWQVLLARCTGQWDVAVGTPVANRGRAELEGLIGCFINTLVVRVELGGMLTFREALGRVREACLGAYANQEVPFERLVEELRPERDLSRPPLFQVLFVLQNMPMPKLALGELALEPVELDPGTSIYDLHLTLEAAGGGLVAALEYNSDLFERGTAERLVERYEVLLGEAVGDPVRRLWELEALGSGERGELERWGRGEEREVAGVCVQELVEEQARRRPGEVAVEVGEEVMSYGELDRRANRLGRHLRRLGVGPEVRVGLSLERGLEMVVGLLGVLKAGGAYVPLDPGYRGGGWG